MARSVEFFFDFGSPTSYLAYTQMPGLAARTGATVVYRPMLLGGVFKATGNQSPVSIVAKGKWMFSDIARFAKRYSVSLNMNPHFPVNTLNAMRGAIAAEMQDASPVYNDAMFQAMWVKGENLSEPSVAAAVLNAAGLDAQRLLAACAEPGVKARLIANTEEAVARGAFGAPTFFVGNEMFFGQDRLDFVEACLEQAL